MADSLTSTQMLVNILNIGMQSAEARARPENLKYVIYLRKSTDEVGRQVRSIEDQRAECLEFAKKQDLKVVSIIEERKSAKESGKRPEFSKMIKLLLQGTYDGVIAWHPDRLARNMKEAGEIIDLLDKKIILDLRFVSFSFTNDTAGKMVLGVTFVIAKQYSDNLSDGVKRGTYRSVNEGKVMGHIEHGYRKDERGYRVPDGENFYLIKNIFTQRLRGNTLDQIALSCNLTLKSAAAKSSRELPKFRKQEVAKILAKPVYAGVLKYGKNQNIINLTEIYDFTPMITPDEYLKLNKKNLDKGERRYYTNLTKVNRKADLLNGVVICSNCSMPMVAGITPRTFRSGVKNYYYFRCDQVGCRNKGKGTRAKVIINYACEYIKEVFAFSELNWKHYQSEAKKDYEEVRGKMLSDLSVLTQQKTSKLNQQNNIKQEIIRLSNVEGSDHLRKSYEEDFEKLRQELEDIESRIDLYKAKASQKLKILGQEEFLEQMKKLPEFIAQTDDMKVLDQALRKIFLNFTVNRKEVVKSTLNSPFNALLTFKIPTSAGGGT